MCKGENGDICNRVKNKNKVKKRERKTERGRKEGREGGREGGKERGRERKKEKMPHQLEPFQLLIETKIECDMNSLFNMSSNMIFKLQEC